MGKMGSTWTESFSWISNVWRRFLVSHSIDLRVVVEFERHPHPTMLQFAVFFGGFPRSSFLTSKSPLLNFLNHSKHCDLPRASSVSFDKHSMRFCSSFLQMVTENQCCPQIVVSRHKIRHVQRYYKLYCMKLVLLWIENLCQTVRTRKWRQWRRQLHWQL